MNRRAFLGIIPGVVAGVTVSITPPTMSMVTVFTWRWPGFADSCTMRFPIDSKYGDVSIKGLSELLASLLLNGCEVSVSGANADAVRAAAPKSIFYPTIDEQPHLYRGLG